MNFAVLANRSLPEDDSVVRELLAYDSLCPACCTFVRDQDGALIREYTPSPLHWSRQIEWPWVLRNGEFDRGMRVLDVGGGWSVLKFALAQRGCTVCCIDIDWESLVRAQPAIQEINRFCNYTTPIIQQVADVRNIPLPDNTFDRVVCVSVLEHVPDGHVKGLNEMLRVLKPGGHLLLTLDIAVEGPLLDKPRQDFFVGKNEMTQVINRLSPIDTDALTLERVRALNILDDQLTVVAVMIKYTKEKA